MPQTIVRGYRQLVDDALAKVKTLSAAEAKAMHGRGDVQFVDLRDVRELEREGRMPGALHCPRGMLEFWIDPASPYHRKEFAADKTFVFFCAAGWRSALATKAAQDMGLKPVAHIDGGFKAWREAGGAFEPPPAPPPAEKAKA
jgi:rhodanese-related sulfurtransferase